MELYRMRSYTTFSNDASQVIERGTEDEMEIHGYASVRWKVFFSQVASFLTLGLWPLILHWRPDFKARILCRPCHLRYATSILLLDGYDQWHLTSIENSDISPTNPPELCSSPTPITERSLLTSSVNKLRYFEYQFMKFVWDYQQETFKRLRGYDNEITCSAFFDKLHGLTESQQHNKLDLYGPNMMDFKIKSYGSLFINEVLNPFYIFQVASIVLWCTDDYYYYASCILFISLVSIAVSLYETKKQMKTLKEMITRAATHTVTVQRHGGDIEEIPATDVVPGDILIIPANGCVMSCDAVLTAGNCIVNESMLTGESVPETKTPLVKSSEDFNIQKHKRNILFCGTQVIQTRYYGHSKVTATVIRTGFSTAKGELVRSIMFPKPMGFEFYRDSMRFVLILLGLALCGMSYSLYLYISRGASTGETIKKALDVITIVVPPALPAALTVGTIYAQSRLKSKGIFCISPPRINVSGKLKLMCFDKTGTLTEEGLDVWGILPIHESRFQTVIHESPQVLGEQNHLLLAMATCHSLTSIDGELAGDPLDLKMFQATEWVLEEYGKDSTRFDLLVPSVVRPPKTLDFWALSGEDNTYASGTTVDGNICSAAKSTQSDDIFISNVKPLPLEVGLVRQFPFSSSLQCMSVICRVLGSPNMDLYSKGAPEKMATLCLPHTIPKNFGEILQTYTLQGLRVLALAHKPLSPDFSWRKSQRVKREKLECDLTMVGLLVMQNALKRETSPVISVLHDANIRIVMITGDNILTAMSVGRDCGLIPSEQEVILVEASKEAVSFHLAETPNTRPSEFVNLSAVINMAESDTDQKDIPKDYCLAIDGKSFSALRSYFPSIFKRILIKGTVFARMTPDEKTQLVESFQEIKYVTGMCGDGANDCGALKAAEMGVSLSEAEASVAAPFTSHIPNIQCVPIIIREGRCALVTSFALFKFIALYSIIQFISVLILYSKGSNLDDPMFLYIDLALITTLAIVMGKTKAYPQLVKERPLSNLVNTANIVSMFLQVILVTSVQAGAIFYLASQKWYHPHAIDPENIRLLCWESTTIFIVSCFQYLIVAIIFSQGPPFRQPFYTNAWYLCVLLVLVGFTSLLLFGPWPELRSAFTMVDWSNKPNHFFYFRLMLLLIAIGNFILSIGAELFVARSGWLKGVSRKLRGKKVPKNEYKNLALAMKRDSFWPPLNATLTSDIPEDTS